MTARKALELLKNLEKLDEFLDTENKWTKNAYARTSKSGGVIDLMSEDARCFCLDGAAHLVAGYQIGSSEIDSPQYLSYKAMHDLFNELLSARGDIRNVIAWNDNPFRTFSEVKALIKEAREYVSGVPE
jgi:hypothetical protein